MAGTILICGSMAHLDAMRALAASLKARGLDAVAPADERGAPGAGTPALKRILSARYFHRIRARGTAAILVANYTRRGRRNHIGPNTFAEIAVAFSADKPVYLLNGIPAPLKDELLAWGVIPLRGDLCRLTRRRKM